MLASETVLARRQAIWRHTGICCLPGCSTLEINTESPQSIHRELFCVHRIGAFRSGLKNMCSHHTHQHPMSRVRISARANPRFPVGSAAESPSVFRMNAPLELLSTHFRLGLPWKEQNGLIAPARRLVPLSDRGRNAIWNHVAPIFTRFSVQFSRCLHSIPCSGVLLSRPASRRRGRSRVASARLQNAARQIR